MDDPSNTATRTATAVQKHYERMPIVLQTVQYQQSQLVQQPHRRIDSINNMQRK